MIYSNLALVVLGQLVRFIIGIFLLKYLSINEYSSYTRITATVSIMAFVIDFGFSTKLLKARNYVKGIQYSTSIYLLTLVLQSFFVLLSYKFLYFSSIMIISVFAFHCVLISSLHKLQQRPYSVNIIENILRVVPFVVGICLYLWKMSFSIFLISINLSAFLISCYMYFICYGIFKLNKVQINKDNASIWLSGFLVVLLNVLDIYLLTWFADDKALASYKMHLQFASLVLLSLSFVNSIYSGQYAKKASSFRKARRLSRYISLLIAISIFVVVRSIIPILLGHKYELDVVLFVMLIATFSLNAWYGPIGLYSNVIGLTRAYINTLLLALLGYILLGMVLYYYAGLYGIVLANLTSTLIWNQRLTKKLRRAEFL